MKNNLAARLQRYQKVWLFLALGGIASLPLPALGASPKAPFNVPGVIYGPYKPSKDTNNKSACWHIPHALVATQLIIGGGALNNWCPYVARRFPQAVVWTHSALGWPQAIATYQTFLKTNPSASILTPVIFYISAPTPLTITDLKNLEKISGGWRSIVIVTPHTLRISSMQAEKKIEKYALQHYSNIYLFHWPHLAQQIMKQYQISLYWGDKIHLNWLGVQFWSVRLHQYLSSIPTMTPLDSH